MAFKSPKKWGFDNKKVLPYDVPVFDNLIVRRNPHLSEKDR